MSLDITRDIAAARASSMSGAILGLSAADVNDRRGYIGASDAVVICGADSARKEALWEVKVGLAEPEDLSDVLAVQMGTWTEAFNLLWLARQTGWKVTHNASQVTHPGVPFLKARADGYVDMGDGSIAVCDAKHVGPFNFEFDTTLETYLPQLAVQMACCDAPRAILSVFVGTSRWEHRVVERDPIYEAQVIASCRKFWDHVVNKTRPDDLPPVVAPVPHALMRTVDMRGNPEWSQVEQTYLATELAAEQFEDAKTKLKKLVEHDVKQATGAFLTIKRDARGALRLSRSK